MTEPSRRPYAELTIGDTKVSLLKDGLQTFPAMLEAIASAKKTICFETYILRDDATGRRFADALGERAMAGVEVNLMFDGWGSSVSTDFLVQLKFSQVRTVVFQPVIFTGRLAPVIQRLKRRNHRKSLIVDSHIGFTGGLNVGNDYAALEDGGQGWRDTHVRLEGPAAVDLQRLFLTTWRKNKGAPVDAPRYVRTTVANAGVRILGNDFRADRKDIRRAYVSAFVSAKRKIYLTHAYFIPPARIVKELMYAARRGVRVAIILAASTDVGFVLWAVRSIYAKLLKAGIEVYEWEGRVLHAKTAVVDARWSTVGSANLDALSLRQNLEVNAVFEDPGIAAALERMFEEDLPSCRRITPDDLRRRTWGERILSWFAYQLRHWL